MPRTQFNKSDLALGYLVLRLTIGMNIMMHGLARLVSGEDKFVAGLTHTFQSSPLPHALVWGFGTVLPWIEAAIGILVLTGLFTRFALTAGGLLMTLFTFGVGTIQNWEAAGLQLSYALVFALLLAAVAANGYSLDALIRRKK